MSTGTAIHAVPNLTLRHWSIDRTVGIEGPSPPPAPALPFAERGADGGQLGGVASKLARLKAEIARQSR
jgi:hypothetical protein